MRAANAHSTVVLRMLAVLSVLLFVTAAAAEEAAIITPPSVAGSWVGKFHGGGGRGMVTLQTVQDGAACTFTGSALDQEGETLTLSGSFTFTKRRFVGTVLVNSDPPEQDPLKGHANKAGTRMNLTIRTNFGTGRRVVVRLTRPS